MTRSEFILMAAVCFILGNAHCRLYQLEKRVDQTQAENGRRP